MDNPDRQGASLGYYLYMIFPHNKMLAVESLPLYKKKEQTGRWTKQNRVEHYFNLAKELGVTQKFVKELFEKEISEGKYIDIGSKIRTKAGVYRKRTRKTRVQKVKKEYIKTHHQICTAKLTPLCLIEFITNQEDTVCLRCQNVRV